MNPSVVLTVVGAAAGVALLLVMAIAPLLTDRHRPRSERPLEPTADTPVVIPVQRGVRGLVSPATHPVRLHAAPR